jgi:DNA-binding FadR family transcriptional regulator
MTLAEISGNPLFVHIHAAIIQWLSDQRTVALQHPDVEESSYAMHERIFRAIAKRSADQAESAVRASLDNVDALYRAAFAQQAAALRRGASS